MPVDKVIINGDLKHEFGTISETEWRNTLGIIDFLLKQCKNIVLFERQPRQDSYLLLIKGKLL